jgi:hypothetical protein
MRFLILTAAVGLAGLGAQAQQTPTTVAPAASVQQDATTTEKRAMSGTLKETLGQLEQVRGMVAKAAADPAMAERAPKLNGATVDMADLSKSIEGMLTKVNQAKPENWAAVKAEAEALNTRALETMANAKQLTVSGK